MVVLIKVLRILLVVIVSTIVLVVLFLAVSIGPVNRTPVTQYEAYPIMMKRLDSLKTLPIPKPKTSFKVGFSKVNLTPSFRTATAGYGNRYRKLFSSVHDSIYVR